VKWPRFALGVCLAAASITACNATNGDGVPGVGASTTVTTESATTAAQAPQNSGTETTSSVGRNASFVTQDGLTLEGAMFGTGNDWVVLAHMRPASMDSWFAFAEVLASAGFTAMPFNFRGYGQSEGSGFAVDVDAAAAVDFAFASGAETVSIIGASMGGTGAMAAAAVRSVASVVTISAPAAFSGVDAVAAMASLQAPILFVAATDDQPYASDIGLLAGAAGGAVNTFFLDGRAHGTNLFGEHGAELTDQILAHLRSSLS
jgi:pimeloyl-ACP methyl ester carboxylesterase